MSVRDAEAIGDDGAAARRASARRKPRAPTRGRWRRRSPTASALRSRSSTGAKGGDVRVRYKTLEQLDEVCRRLRG